MPCYPESVSAFDFWYHLAFANITQVQTLKRCAGLKSCGALSKLWAWHGRLMQGLFPLARLCVALWHTCMLNRTVWCFAVPLSLRCIEKGKCSCYPASLLTWTHTCACTFVHHVSCSVGSPWERQVSSCLLVVKFYEGFCRCEVAVPAVSSTLLQSLTPASKVSLAELQIYCCRTVCLCS